MDKTDTECFDCGKVGHWRGDSRCKNPKPRGRRGRGRRQHGAHVALFSASTAEAKDKSWILDTAASASMSPLLDADISEDREVTIGDGHKLSSIGTCTQQIIGDIQLKDILVVPEMTVNLISVGALCDQGVADKVEFTKHGCKIIKNGRTIQDGVRRDKIYIIKENESAYVSLEKWHQRLCHWNTGTIQKMANNDKSLGLTIAHAADRVKRPPCRICALTKRANTPFPKHSTNRETAPGRTLHVEICGPMEIDSLQGCRYVMPVTDDYSRFTVAYFLTKKSDAIEHLMKAIRYFEGQSGNNVTNIRADNGGEFTSTAARKEFHTRGIVLLTSVPYSPQQNGVAERKNRTLVEATRALLRTASLPKRFWQYAMATAVHVTNRLPSTANDGRSPYQLWNGTTPDIKYMRTFGCQAYPYVPKQKRRKMDDRATSCIFIGYPTSQKGYLMMDLQSKRVFASRAVTFDETRFPCQTTTPRADTNAEWHQLPNPNIPEAQETSDNDRDPEPDEFGQDERPIPSDLNGLESPDRTILSGHDSVPENVARRDLPPRNRQPPIRFIDEQEDLQRGLSHSAFIAADCEPTSAQEALQDESWRQAMTSEYGSLTRNSTWDLVRLPPGRQPITGKWCFKLKTDATGTVVRKKARYVARGFSQKDGIDYDETFAPVISFASFRILLSIAAKHKMEITQIDVDTAYLYGDIDKELYLAQPEGLEKF